MDLAELDFELPPELVAQQPLSERSASRLLVVERQTGTLTHSHFNDIGAWLRPGDLLVANDARVLPARTHGTRCATGGKLELVFLHRLTETPETWEVMLRTRGKPQAGEELELCQGALRVRLLEGSGRVRQVQSLCSEPLAELLERHGELPLPPYIQRSSTDPRASLDRERYQTVYADKPVAAAAPTAGLHFSDALLAELAALGIERRHLTLEVGPGTFLPIKSAQVEEHPMHGECYQVPEATLTAARNARAAGGRVVAVGTTSLRALEAAVTTGQPQGRTELFITPPYDFQSIDGLLTNFHFPRSTLLLLVMAWTGKDLLWRAYREAIERRYRFFSYGDAMLLL